LCAVLEVGEAPHDFLVDVLQCPLPVRVEPLHDLRHSPWGREDYIKVNFNFILPNVNTHYIRQPVKWIYRIMLYMYIEYVLV